MDEEAALERSEAREEHEDPSFAELRMPPSLRMAYLLVVMSFTCGLATLATLTVTLIFGATVVVLLLFVFPLLGAATACGAVVAGVQELRPRSRHAPLSAFVMVLGTLEALGWLLVCLLPVM